MRIRRFPQKQKSSDLKTLEYTCMNHYEDFPLEHRNYNTQILPKLTQS